MNFYSPNLGSIGDFCQAKDGGPALIPALPGVMDNQTMIDTQLALNLGFWETVFGNANAKKLEKAANSLDTVTSFMVESE